jgi:hypothetical protein
MNPNAPLRRRLVERICFSSLAWLKLQWFCHAGHTEVGGFAISAENNPLYVEDLITVKQYVTPVSVRFDDVAVAELFDDLVDRGIPVSRFARLWVHTHPGDSALPSAVDEETFARTFGSCDWAVMFIVSRTGQTYARLSFAAGPGGEMLLPTVVQWGDWPGGLTRIGSLDRQVEKWQREYEANVQMVPELQVQLRNDRDPREDCWETIPWNMELDGTCYEPIPQGEADEFPF